MTDKLNVNAIEPEGATTTMNVGRTGKNVIITDNLKANTLKDAGGNTLFTSNGSGVLSSVNSAFGKGGPTLLDTETASGHSELNFESNIDSNYSLYIFRFYDYNPATDNTHLTFQGSINAGGAYAVAMTTTVFYARHYESDASTLTYDSGDDQMLGTGYQKITLGVGNDSDASASGELYLLNPSSTTYITHWWCESQLMYALDASTNYYSAGYFNTADNIDAISFKPVSGNFDGVIKMYGLN